MIYPEQSSELIQLLAEDQSEAREQSKIFYAYPNSQKARIASRVFVENSNKRIKRVLEILKEINEPSIANIGEDGSQAVSVIALHSRIDFMKKILSVFEECYLKDPSSIHHEAIPTLKDRILIFEKKPQLYGSQWMLGEDGKLFLPNVKDFKNLNLRRKAFGLEPARRPIDLTYGIPKIKPKIVLAKETDQRSPTDKEYNDYVRYRLSKD